MTEEKINKFLSHERTLGKVIRFSARTRIKDETVAEHSFHVALYCMILADLEEKFGNKVNKEKLIKAALLHDLEECLTGDIIFDFKHSDEKLAREIKKMSLQFYKGLVSNLPENLSREYINLWENGKNQETIEGRILQAADKLEALMYAIEEFKMGNKNFEDIIVGLKEILKKMKLKSLDVFMKQLFIP